MPKVKKAMSAVSKLTKARHRTVNRAAKRKRKNRVSNVEAAPEEVPEGDTIEIEDTVKTETQLLAERDPATVLPNHSASTSSKTSNGFESPLPQVNGKVEHNFIPESDTSSIFNRLGYSEDVLSALPNRTWAIHSVEVPEKRIVVSSMIMHNSYGTGLEPLYIKQIVFDEKLNFDLFLLKSRLVLKDKPSMIGSMHDFEDLVDYVESLKICNGGPAVSQYSNINPECAYKDPLNKWRHNLCSLEISVGEVCESCSSLEEILQRHVQRNKPSLTKRRPESSTLRNACETDENEERMADLRESDEDDEERMADSRESDEDDEILGMPTDLVEAAENLRADLLPAKSRERYRQVYDTFIEWKTVNKVNVISENVMLAYFGELAKKYKPPTLWSTYSMLRSTLSINDKVNLSNFKLIVAFLKEKSSGYHGKKSKTFTANEIKRFLDEAPNYQHLVTKVVLIFGISGACRTGELTNLTVQNVLNYGDIMIVKLRDTKTKTNRSFTIEGEYRKKVMAYQALRPTYTRSDRFFVNYRNGRCTNQVIGKNKISGMSKEIAQFLKLPDPDLYTGHSFRRSSGTLCADEGADTTKIKLEVDSGSIY